MTGSGRFQSALGPQIQAYVEYKQALGLIFKGPVCVLRVLDRFLSQQRADDLTPGTFDAWSQTLGHLSPRCRRQYLSIARHLCLYRRRTDAQCFVPDSIEFPDRGPQRPALILSEAQIQRLLDVAAALPARAHSPLQPEVYRQAITLGYACGLRRGELIRLAVSDCDLHQRTLLVQQSKGRKSRLVALSDSVAKQTGQYLLARERFPHARDAPLLVHGRHCSLPYSGRGIDCGFQRLFRNAGIRGVGGRPARLHDLRHSHAVHVLLRCYHEGIDPQSRLPALAASMGHVSLASTAYYLNEIEPVIQQAGERFARYARSIAAPLPGDDHA